jgi:hypothetical protein
MATSTRVTERKRTIVITRCMSAIATWRSGPGLSSMKGSCTINSTTSPLRVRPASQTQNPRLIDRYP